MPDWVEFILLATAWGPVLVLIHELGHALAALALTDGDVSIDLRHAGLSGGSVSFEDSRVRSRGGLVAIVAAGPATSLAAAVLLSVLWLAGGPPWDSSVLTAGAFTAVFLFVLTALPLTYGGGIGVRGDSDGLVIWKILTGGPRREVAHDGTRRPFLWVLAAVGLPAVAVDPTIAVWLVALFGVAYLLERVGARG